MSNKNTNQADWQNHPAPAIEQSLVDELTKVGGIIPPGCGEFSGKPMFVFAWGMDEREFKNGKNRLRWLKRQRRVKREYGVSNYVYEKMIGWLSSESTAAQNAYMTCDFAKAFALPEITDFLKNNFIEDVDYLVLDASQTMDDKLRRVAIRDFRFVADCAFLEQIGYENYFILRYMPSPEVQKTAMPHFGTMLDTEAGWEGRRFGKGYYPETKEEKMLDVLGEYPKYGGYFHEFLCLEDEDGDYVAPGNANVIEPVKAYLRAREELTASLRNNKDYRVGADYASELAQFDRELFNWEVEFEEMFENSVPAFTGNEFVAKHKDTPEIILATK